MPTNLIVDIDSVTLDPTESEGVPTAHGIGVVWGCDSEPNHHAVARLLVASRALRGVGKQTVLDVAEQILTTSLDQLTPYPTAGETAGVFVTIEPSEGSHRYRLGNSASVELSLSGMRIQPITTMERFAVREGVDGRAISYPDGKQLVAWPFWSDEPLRPRTEPTSDASGEDSELKLDPKVDQIDAVIELVKTWIDESEDRADVAALGEMTLVGLGQLRSNVISNGSDVERRLILEQLKAVAIRLRSLVGASLQAKGAYSLFANMLRAFGIDLPVL